MKKTLQILNLIAVVFTIAMGYASNTGIFNGNTMADVSAKHQNLFTPSGYAFSIWGLIYLGLLGFAIYYSCSLFSTRKKEDLVIQQVGWWFIISCIANSLWVVAWPYDYTLLSVILMVILLFSLLKIVINTQMELYDAPLKKFLFLWWPFCFYSGWVAVALIANVAAYLTKIGWNAFGLSETVSAVVMILIAGIVNVFMIWNRNMREFALVGVWSLIAIAVSNKDSHSVVLWSAVFTAIGVFINIAVHGYQNRKSNPFLQVHQNKESL